MADMFTSLLPFLGVIVLAGLLAGGLTDLLKRVLRLLTHPLSDTLGDVVLRSFAVLVGIGTGIAAGSAHPAVGSLPIGAILGGIGGSFSTLIVYWWRKAGNAKFAAGVDAGVDAGVGTAVNAGPAIVAGVKAEVKATAEIVAAVPSPGPVASGAP